MRRSSTARPPVGRRLVGRPGFAAAGAALVAAVLTLAACDGGDGATTAPEVPADAENAAQLRSGRQIFIDNCANCHGIAGGGGSAPKMSGGAVKRRFPNVNEQIAFVKSGGGAMPGFGNTLSQDQIEAVVLYEREILNNE